MKDEEEHKEADMKFRVRMRVRNVCASRIDIRRFATQVPP